MATTPGGGAKILVAGLALGALTAGLLYMYLRRMSEFPKAHWQKVVVARMQIPANSKLTQDMVTVALLPPETIVPNALRDIRAIEKKLAKRDLFPHQQILDHDLMVEGEIPSLAVRVPEGKRAIAIAATEVTAVGSVIKPGDRVDILATYRDPVANEETTQMILQNVLVLAVNQGQTDPTTAQGAKTSMTLAVAPEDTELITAADQAGRLRISLRSPHDTTVYTGTGVTVKDISGGRVRVTIPPPPAATETKDASELSPPKTPPTPIVITATNVAPATEKPPEIIIYRGTEAKTVVP